MSDCVYVCLYAAASLQSYNVYALNSLRRNHSRKSIVRLFRVFERHSQTSSSIEIINIGAAVGTGVIPNNHNVYEKSSQHNYGEIECG